MQYPKLTMERAYSAEARASPFFVVPIRSAAAKIMK
jgi:hypothetical protein